MLPGDTSSARYLIEHGQGSTVKQANQALHSNNWLVLGVYPFAEGTAGTVSLTDVTSEVDYTRTVSAGALRFTRVPEEMVATDFLYIPSASR